MIIIDMIILQYTINFFIICKPWPIMLNFLFIMLLSNAQKITYNAQYYPMTTVIMPQFVYDFIIFSD